MGFELRPLKPDNIDEKNQFLGILKDNYTSVPYEPTDKLFTPDKYFFFAYEGERLVGVTGFAFKTPTLAETIKTVVLPECRGKGYGQKLSDLIEQKCKQEGIKKVISTIYAKNTKMIAIKMAQGYTIEGYHPDHEAPGWHEYSLGKILS